MSYVGGLRALNTGACSGVRRQILETLDNES